MCGRFVATRPVEDIANLLDVDDIEVAPELARPRWNVAPQATILAVTATPGVEGHRRLATFRWGLVPSWAKDPGIGARAFNARAETVAEKPMFRAAVSRRRCIVPVDAFYEWTPPPEGSPSKHKQPWCFQAADGGLLTLAGLWEEWRPLSPGGDTRDDRREPPLRTCTIITTEANGLVGRFHNRMPVVIGQEDFAEWLAPEPLDPGELEAMTRPARDEILEVYPVSTRVNNALAEGPELAEPIPSDGLLPD